MPTDISLEVASLNIASFYQANQSAMNGTMLTVASGNRVNGPNDDVVDYSRINTMNSEVNELTQLQNTLVDGAGMMQVAQEAGTYVYNDLTSMQQLVNSYYAAGTTAAQQGVDAAQFTALQQQIAATIGSADYDGTQVISANNGAPLWSSMIDPSDPTQQLAITYDPSDIVDASGLTLGASGQASESAALQAQVDAASSYLAKTTNYTDMIDDQNDLMSGNIATLNQTVSNEQGADEGAAMMALSTQNIYSQSAMSMLAQANTDRTNTVATLLQNL
jgi:flagellin-like hook-associated protein FlgL